MARNPGILFQKPSLIRSPPYYSQWFFPCEKRTCFVCLCVFSQPHIIAQKVIWYFIGVQYIVHVILFVAQIKVSLTSWKEGQHQPLSSIMSSVNPNSLCKKSLNFDLSIFSPLASVSNTPNKPITSSLVTEIAKIKIQFFYRLYITMQLYCYIAMCRNSSLGFHPYTQRLHATSRFYHKSLVIFGIE